MLLGGEQTGLPLVLESVAFAPDVEHMTVVQQPVQDGRGNDSAPRNSANSLKRLLEVRMICPVRTWPPRE